jgi:protein TonB
MSRDLFAATVVARPKRTRARWMVVLSVVAHVGVLAIVLVGPILSATQGIVALARGVVYVEPVSRPLPQPPAARSTQPVAPTVDPNAAPPQAPEKPVTTEVTNVSSGPPGPPSLDIPRGGGVGVPGAPTDITIVKPVPPAPTPKATPPIVYRIGGQFRAPQRLVYVAPEYPKVALAARIEASVTVDATIDEQGNVRNVRVVRSSSLFDKAAIDAVSQWKYQPTLLNGQAVPVILTVTVVFEIKR